jgi:HlyD family secretion protein
MKRTYILTLLAMVGFAMAAYTVFAQGKPLPVAEPVAEPSKAPYAAYVAGSGIVEASTRNIAVGTPVSGVVIEVLVEAGATVKAGDALFKLETRSLDADLLVEQASELSALANLQKLLDQPRAEDIPPLEARVKEAEANVADLKAQLAMWQAVNDKRAVSQEELDRRRYAVEVGEARLSEAKAQLDLTRAGAWKPDVEVARAQVASAAARVKQIQIEIERLTVRSPVDGEVLQVNVRTGEFASAGTMSTPLMLVGSVEMLHVRVDVDENDAWRVKKGAKAKAFIRGNNALNAAIEYVRTEPYVIPKRSLTGESTERVDTRVLQVIFRFPRSSLPVYVGQLMDVFIEAEPLKSN